MIFINDLVSYKGQEATVIGFTSKKILLKTVTPKSAMNPFGPPKEPEPSKILKASEKDIKPLISLMDKFYIMREPDNVLIFGSIEDLKKAITPANMGAEMYEVKKLGKPTISFGKNGW